MMDFFVVSWLYHYHVTRFHQIIRRKSFNMFLTLGFVSPGNFLHCKTTTQVNLSLNLIQKRQSVGKITKDLQVNETLCIYDEPNF